MNKFHPITILLIILFAIIFLTGCSTTKPVHSDFGSTGGMQELTTWGKFSNWLGEGDDDTYRTAKYGFKQYDRLYGGKPVGSIRFSQRHRPLSWRKYQDDPDHRQIHFWFK